MVNEMGPQGSASDREATEQPPNSLAAWKVFLALLAVGAVTGAFVGVFGYYLRLFG
jgi:uncharacterized protein involved in exopolysaccharide biosynthesis